MNLRITTDVCVRSALHKGTWPVVQVGNIFYSTPNYLTVLLSLTSQVGVKASVCSEILNSTQGYITQYDKARLARIGS